MTTIDKLAVSCILALEEGKIKRASLADKIEHGAPILEASLGGGGLGVLGGMGIASLISGLNRQRLVYSPAELRRLYTMLGSIGGASGSLLGGGLAASMAGPSPKKEEEEEEEELDKENQMV